MHDLAVGLELGRELGKSNGAMALVDLDGVASAEGDVGAGFAVEIAEVMALAGLAVRAGLRDGHLRALVAPEVVGEQGAADAVARAHEELQALGRLDRSKEVHRGVEDAGGIAGLNDAGGGGGKDAAQAGGLAGDDVHGKTIGADGCRIYPGNAVLHGEIVDEVAGLEVVGSVEDEIGAREERFRVGRNQVRDGGFHHNMGVETGDIARRRGGFGQGLLGV